MAQIWALIVSIENYYNKAWRNAGGATKDAELTIEYLLGGKAHDDLPKNIVHLKDENALRDVIISTFRSHLIDNPEIKEGDAIFFHFSGHGTRTSAPKNWFVLADDGEWETILPWDDGKVDKTGQRICGIPDRTLGGLLDSVARKHGRNITVVLDCCHSSSGTRGPASEESLPPDFDDMYPPRYVNPNLTAPMRDDMDTDVLGDLLKKVNEIKELPSKKKPGFQHIGTQGVLMAACGQFEKSRGTKEEGGFFTKNWIKSLRAQSLGLPQTYEEMLKLVDIEIEKLRDLVRSKGKGDPRYEAAARQIQHPACEGPGGRIVFTEAVRDPNSFITVRRQDLGDNICRVEAGVVQGIQDGTLFELRELDSQFRTRRVMGSAIAKTVESTWCIAEYHKDIQFTDMLCVAIVQQHAWHLRFSISTADSEEAKLTHALFQKSFEKASAEDRRVLEQKEHTERSDLHLEIDKEGGVDFHRRDSVLCTLQTKPPRIEPHDAEHADFIGILKSIARFNWNLALTSQQHPFRDNVSLEFHRIDADASTLPENTIVGLKELIPIVRQEVSVVEDDKDGYAFVLRNETSKDLYPYLLCFDPGTYEIDRWYQPVDLKMATLRAGKSLQLGSSSELRDILQFCLPEVLKPDIDTTIMKVYLLDTPGVSMDFAIQKGVLGYDSNRNNNVRRSGKVRGDGPTAESKGQWDTLGLRVTVRKA